jgi:hypothetical protein
MSLSFFMWRYIALHFHSRVSFSTLSARSEARTSLYLFISLFLFYWSQGGLVGGFVSSTPTLVIPLSLGIALASTDSASALNQAMWISPVGMYAPPNFPFVSLPALCGDNTRRTPHATPHSRENVESSDSWRRRSW